MRLLLLAFIGAFGVAVYLTCDYSPVGLRLDLNALDDRMERIECASDPACLP